MDPPFFLPSGHSGAILLSGSSCGQGLRQSRVCVFASSQRLL
jgi:hypothetical protein